MSDPADLPAVDAAHRIREGRLTSEALVTACLTRIDQLEPDVQAWTFLDREQALAQARVADERAASGAPIGPLHGLPVGIKDIIATADMPTEDGTAANRGRQPDTDATCVALLRAAGAVIMGKTVTTELATRHPGKTRNPRNLNHTPGGSSSGSAAAVAANMVPLALGTQTAGSVTRPASFCGIFGLKPTLGMIPRTGVTVQSHTLDTVGVYGRSLADVALLANVLSSYDPADEVSYPRPKFDLGASLGQPHATPPRLAFLKTTAWPQADSASQTAILDFVAGLADACSAQPMPAACTEVMAAQRTVQYAENAHHFRAIEQRARAQLTPTLQGILDEARTVTAADYLAAVRARPGMYDAIAGLLDEFDAILCLSACGPAPRGLESTGNPAFNGLWTFLGVPSITLPLLEVDGLPLGVQLIGRRREEAKLLTIADWLWRRCSGTRENR
ncbi:MAG: amidase [Hyphomicrobiaceae bacterium]|nr:amidase [Hyphomicrobiaceae bacterium]